VPGDQARGGLHGSPYRLRFSGSHAPVVALQGRARQCTDAAPAAGPTVNAACGRGTLRVIDGGRVRNDSVARLHRFQGEHPEVVFTTPHRGGHGRYIARIPAGTIPSESREVTLTSADLTGLMDRLDDLLPLRDGSPDPEPT